jgi:hypothetical protein
VKGFYKLYPSVRVQQIGYNWTDFYKILRSGILLKSVDEVKVQ